MQLGQLGVKSTTYNQIDKHYTPKDTHTHTHIHTHIHTVVERTHPGVR